MATAWKSPTRSNATYVLFPGLGADASAIKNMAIMKEVGDLSPPHDSVDKEEAVPTVKKPEAKMKHRKAELVDWTTNVLWDQSAVEDKYGRLKPSRVDGGYHACWWFKENGTFQLVSRADVGFGTGISVVYKSEIKKYTAVEEPPELPPWPGAAAASLIRRRTISR